MKVLNERIPRSSAAVLASELKIKSYSTLKIPRSCRGASIKVEFLEVMGERAHCGLLRGASIV